MDNPILWTPSNERVESSNLYRFIANNQSKHGLSADDYDGFLNWSLDRPEAFYKALWDELDIIGERGEQIIADAQDIRQVRFFPQARFNYAENALRNPDSRLAIIAHRDDGTRRTVTRGELYVMVAKTAAALKAKGVGEGDRVAAIVTNDIEAIAGYLATSSIGAIWASCSPDFGPAGAADRLAQIDPKVLIAVPHYSYAGKHIDVCASINAVIEACDVQHLILTEPAKAGTQFALKPMIFEPWIAPFANIALEFNRLPLDAPMVILFSSGTTGKPKCIVHKGGGMLIKHLTEIVMHSDIKPGEKFFYYTTCGWMMWNWLVSGLAAEATIVSFDGNPFYPQPKRLVDLIDDEQLNIFGTSAKYIDALNNHGLIPLKTHDLSSLKSILSTGSPLLPESFDYIYQSFKPDVALASISGGTDICGCFMGAVPFKPVRKSELQGAQLGMALDTLDDEGHSVSGVPGEFVCKNAHPSMPVGFWGDEDGSRYEAAYFEKFDNMWAHGDFVEQRPGGSFIIHGRSDATLNPGGVRIGTAEIYRQVETIADIEEAIAVGQNWNGDQRVILFVRTKQGALLDEEMIKLIKSRIRAGATPRHVPAKVIQVDDIPRTRSGKISEIAVRDVIHGRVVKNTTALANAECLDAYKDIELLQTD